VTDAVLLKSAPPLTLALPPTSMPTPPAEMVPELVIPPEKVEIVTDPVLLYPS